MRAAGFTLLEMLVAMAIFALVGAMAYTGLDRAIAIRTQLKTVRTTWEARALAWYRLRADLSAVRPRPVRDGMGTLVPALVIYHPTHRTRVSFTIGGLAPLEERGRSDLRRVSYTVKNGQLLWRRWDALDRAPDDRRVTVVLLRHVTHWRVRVLASNGRLVRDWPMAGQLALLPTLMTVTIQLANGHRLRWLFPVAR